jgi:hypothetical protein
MAFVVELDRLSFGGACFIWRRIPPSIFRADSAGDTILSILPSGFKNRVCH